MFIGPSVIALLWFDFFGLFFGNQSVFAFDEDN